VSAMEARSLASTTTEPTLRSLVLQQRWRGAVLEPAMVVTEAWVVALIVCYFATGFMTRVKGDN